MAAAAAEPEDVQMEELEHEIEAAAAPEEPEQAEDELAGEPEEENTGRHPRTICQDESLELRPLHACMLLHMQKAAGCVCPTSVSKVSCPCRIETPQ